MGADDLYEMMNVGPFCGIFVFCERNAEILQIYSPKLAYLEKK